jgi:hypothetical protein
MLRQALALLAVLANGLTPGRAQDCVGPRPAPRSLLRESKIIFVGTVVEPNPASLRVRFRVTEKFKGKAREYVDLAEFPNGMHFETGEQYLVFGGSCGWTSDKDCLTSVPCSDTRSFSGAQAVIEQLRAEIGGRQVASVYGMLFSMEDDPSRPLPNVVVRLRRGTRSFETKTDERGAYAFEQLPKGNYQVSADLPPHLEIAGLLGTEPVKPFDLPSNSSFEYDILAYPTGLITGRVIGPDGQPLYATRVDLYRLDQYTEGERGIYGYQGPQPPLNEWVPFKFDHLSAGNYILVFNYADEAEPDEPFHRTFYPHAARLEDAQVIHLSRGQQIANADIHVGNASPTRPITVRIAWSGRKPEEYSPALVIAEAGGGTQTWRFVGHDPDTYTLNLWQSAQYSIRATASCRARIRREAKTNIVVVDGGDPSVSEITLTFDKGDCLDR